MLLTDCDREPLPPPRDQGIAQEVAPLRDFEQALQPRPCGEFRLLGERLRAAQMHRHGARRCHRHVEEIVGFLHEDVQQLRRARLGGARIAQPIREGGANLLQREARQALVEDDGHFLHGFGRERRRHFHEDRPDRAAAQREHQEQPIGGNL